MNHEYDVVVVGGRVAGASTAMLLARQGHRVLVVERSAMPSDTVSTHAIMRTGVLQLKRWGVLDEVAQAGTPPIRHITLGFGDERVEFEVKDDFGVDAFYAPRRYVLDGILLDAAAEAGAVIWDRTTMKNLLRDSSGRVTGIEASRGRSREQITARFVVGADGHTSRVAALAGAETYRSHEAKNTVHYAYFEGVEAPGFWFQFTPGVNAGIIPTNEGQCLVFVGRPSSLRSRFTANPEGEFMDLLEHGGPDLAKVVKAGKRASRFHGTAGVEGFFRVPFGPGWALVGDAGYTEDPISAHGISDALRDAELCARAIDRSVREPGAARDAFGWYRTLRDSLSDAIYAQASALAGFEWGAAEASARMRVVSDEIRAECETLLALPNWDSQPVPVRV